MSSQLIFLAIIMNAGLISSQYTPHIYSDSESLSTEPVNELLSTTLQPMMDNDFSVIAAMVILIFIASGVLLFAVNLSCMMYNKCAILNGIPIWSIIVISADILSNSLVTYHMIEHGPYSFDINIKVSIFIAVFIVFQIVFHLSQIAYYLVLFGFRRICHIIDTDTYSLSIPDKIIWAELSVVTGLILGFQVNNLLSFYRNVLVCNDCIILRACFNLDIKEC